MGSWDYPAVRNLFRGDGANIALAQVGIKESPPHSNRTKYGKWYGLDGFPWCAQFACWIYDQACTPLALANPLVGLQSKNGFSHVTTVFAKMPKAWILRPSELPLPMDLFMYDHDNEPLGPGHVEVCVGISSNGRNAILVGGNTRPLGKATPEELRSGGTVAKHVHGQLGDDGKHGRLLGVVRPSRRFYIPAA